MEIIPMGLRRTHVLLAVLSAVYGCSADSAKRITYETLQNIQQQQCLKAQGLDCDKRQSYDDYQRQLKKEQDKPSP